MTHRSSWKRREQKIASYLKTRRTPLSGGNSGHTRSDTLHPTLFVEVKMRPRFPPIDYWRECSEEATSREIPILCVHEKGNPDYWVLWYASDSMDLLQALNAPKGQTHTKDYIRKTHALVTLWKDTAELAAEEDKLPMLGIVEKGRHGFWFMCHHGDLRLILEHIDHTHKLPEGEDLATWMSMRYNAN